MSQIFNPTSKVELQGQGMGIPVAADLERRARELAQIAGHASVSEEDREAARAEFTDHNLPDPVNADRDSTQSASRDPSDPVVERGHQTPEYVEADEKANLEKLALEGVEEAQHDQMVSARRRKQD